jgi:DNA repair exonuclease SbcCD nuclease subunit
MNKKIKIVFHIGDIHIRNMKFHKEYVECFNNLLEQLYNLSKDLTRDEIRIVIAGDLVHSKITISNELYIMCVNFISELEKVGNVIIIAGNHDLLETNKNRTDSITPVYIALKDKNISYFKESNCYLDNNIVWCVYSIFEENKRPNIESAREQFGADKTYIGLFHGPIIGSKTDLGFVVEHGSNTNIFNGLDAAMLGDIHMQQDMPFTTNDGKVIPIAYCSSLIQQNYGESIKKHGFLMWDIDSLRYKHYEVDNQYLYYNFTMDSLDVLTNGGEILKND